MAIGKDEAQGGSTPNQSSPSANRRSSRKGDLQGMPALAAQAETFLEVANAREKEFRDAGGTCFNCRDTGHFRGSGPCPYCDRGHAYAAEKRAREVARLVHEAEIDMFAKRTLDTWLTASGGPPALTAVLHRWVEEWSAEQPFLLLHGPTGTGKSSLAAALLRDEIQRTLREGWRCVVPALLTRLRPGPEQAEYLAPHAARVPLLILDDLGVTKPSEWVEEQVYGVVNARYERNKWTIITTNQSPDDGTFLARIGERCFWRIHELSLSVEVNHGNLRDR